MQEKKSKNKDWICICITDSLSVYLKLTQNCKSTILQEKKILIEKIKGIQKKQEIRIRKYKIYICCFESMKAKLRF